MVNMYEAGLNTNYPNNTQINTDDIQKRIRACNYLVVAQLFLQDNFLLERHLSFEDIKPRLLGHWGTCPGVNIVYANLRAFYGADFQFVLGPGHGFPALQANLFLDGRLAEVDPAATPDLSGLEYICRNFSWPGGFPSHASPVTPGVVCEGGELGYALATAYGMALGHPTAHVAVLIGDGELETATALASLQLNQLLQSPDSNNGHVLPILHLNGYKISGPTLAGRKSVRELNQTLRGFGFTPLWVEGNQPADFQATLAAASTVPAPFIIFQSDKGLSGPLQVGGQKISGNYLSHQIPLPHAGTDRTQLAILEKWLRSYRFNELFDKWKGFKL